MATQPWHIRESAQFDRERREVELAYPGLVFTVGATSVVIEGLFPVKEHDTLIDEFAVRITVTENHPVIFPKVHETGGRIPKEQDRHIYPSSGDACVMLPEERWKVCPLGSSLLAFLDGPVRNYFISQLSVEQGHGWPFGQFDHGISGQKQYYREVFGTDNVPAVRRYLKMILGKQIKGHWDCPCGSGLRLRHCHWGRIVSLRAGMPKVDALITLERLAESENEIIKETKSG